FIARYRKEATESLDEVALVSIRDRLVQLAELDRRREAIVASLAERGRLPRFLAVRNDGGVPARAASALTAMHVVQIGAVALGLVDVADLIGVANGLFLLNALLVVAAGARLFPSPAARWGSTGPDGGCALTGG
ncbi:MAG: hypothetical protein EOM10_02900, partial [Opitutae bacterium]|nr:hypothetical protein [Opitutae bacterium]